MAEVIATRPPGVELNDGRFLAFGAAGVNVDTGDPRIAGLLADGLLVVSNPSTPPVVDPAAWPNPHRVVVSTTQPTAAVGAPVMWFEVDSAGALQDVKSVVMT